MSFLVIYVSIATLIGLVSAYLAHVAHSSPAWQAAFSYGLTPQNVKAAVGVGSSPGKVYEWKGEKYPQLRTDSYDILGTSVGGRVGPVFGFAVEALRAFICLIMFLLAAGFLYNEMLPTDRTGWAWFRVPYNVGFLLFGIFILGWSTHYHLVLAPHNLAQTDTLWNFPAVETGLASNGFELRRLGDIWKAAGPAWMNTSLQDRLLSGAQVPDSGSEWKRMYLYPYIWYLPYSLVNFVFVAFPLFFVCIKGTIFSFSRVGVFLRAMEGRLLKAQADKSPAAANAAVSQVRETFHMCRSGLRTYLFFMLVLGVSGIYEAKLGYLTLATAAIGYVILAIILLLLGTVLVSVIFVVYDKGVSKGQSALSNQGVDSLETAAATLTEFGVGRLLRDPITAVLMPLNIILLGYTVYSLVEAL